MKTFVTWTGSILAALCLNLVASPAFAATIKSVKKSISIVDISTEDALVKGEAACIYDDDDNEVTCGKISRLSKSGKTGAITVKKSARSKIKVGMTVRGKDAGKAGGSKSSASVSKSTNKTKIWVSYAPAIMAPAKYKKIAYLVSSEETPSTWWEQGSDASEAYVGFSLQVGIPIGSMALHTGLRQHTYTETAVDADYNNINKSRFVRVVQSASALGLWADFRFWQTQFGSMFDFFTAAGLDFDLSTMKFTATKMDDGATALPSEEIASAESSVTVISLRVATGLDIMFTSAFGAHLGLTIQAPLAAAGAKSSGKAEDAEKPGSIDPGKDLSTKLAHEKSSFGLEATIGAVLAF